MRTLALLAALALLTAVSGCAAPTARSSLDSAHITPGMLLDASPLVPAATAEPSPAIDLLDMTPEMRAFVDAHVNHESNRYARLKDLLFAIMRDGDFELIYDDSTRTAAGTFNARRGNCLSFTNMFVAMARYLDLEAHYQELEIPPDWSLAGQSFLLSQHVNVYVDLGHDEVRIVDFNIMNFSTTFEHRVISDQRARAHFYNNIGAEHMLSGESLSAHENFRAAALADPDFAPAWINLGILHRREGFPNYAEAAYLQALAVDRFNLVAMSNVANLYEQEGQFQRAADYRARVASHRNKNPYYRYHLAGDAFVNGDYASAIDNLKYAIRKRDDEPLFYSLLSLSYLMSGDRQAARQWMAKAAAVSRKAADQQKYQHKLEWLQNMAANG